MPISRFLRLVVLLSFAALIVPTSAQADVYLGAGAYKSEAQIRELDDEDTTAGLFLGYVIVDTAVILSAEIGYYDLGSYDDKGIEVDAQALTLAGVLSLALGPFIELYGKAGVAAVDLEINDKSEDGEEAFLGAGLGLDFFDTVDIYVEYLEFDTEVDSSLLGAGIRLQF